MSPKTKKILLIGGGVVAAYVVYNMMKKPATAVAPVATAPTTPAVAPNTSFYTGVKAISGVEEDLGSLGNGCSEMLAAYEELGSLGGGCRETLGGRRR